jgi:hypothetical protein
MIKKMYLRLHIKYPLFLSDFNETSVFETDFGEKIQISNSKKIREVLTELFRTNGGRTDGHARRSQ